MARAPIMAAGGIVLRREQPPLIAVVRLRKRAEWVLPKGKLDPGETPRDAARREVLEETGHKVTVHEFLGTLVQDTGTRAKVVHYWRMEAADEPSQPLMDDVRAVDWLRLDAAVERLSRDHEKTFLEAVGPYALAGLIRNTKAKAVVETASKSAVAKPAAAETTVVAKKRRSRVTQPSVSAPPPPVAAEAAPDTVPPDPVNEPVLPAAGAGETVAQPEMPEAVALDAIAPTEPMPDQAAPQPAAPASAPGRVPADVERVEAVVAAIKSLVPDRSVPRADAATAGTSPAPQTANPEPENPAPEHSEADGPGADNPSDGEPRRTLTQKMRAWLGRAA